MRQAGIILVDKPAGWTSHDALARLKRLLEVRKAGHCGTLDPLATGLLVVCLNSATRLADLFIRHDKTYLATVRFGRLTDTDDADGRTIAEADPSGLTLDQIGEALASFVGLQLQIPPRYSAIKVGGERLYRLARAGKEVNPPAREVVFHRLALRDWQSPDLTLLVECSAGTYVRSLARDLGQKLRVGAHLANLRRLASGHFSIDQAYTLDDIVSHTHRGDQTSLLVNCLDALADWPRVELPPLLFTPLVQGQAIQYRQFAAPMKDGRVVVVQQPLDDQLVIARVDSDGWLRPDKLIAGNPVPAGV